MMDFVKPKRCNFALSYKCMFKCKMCYLWQSDENGITKPNITRWKEILSSLREISSEKTMIHFGGGEPLLVIDSVLELIRISKNLEYETSIATNGYLVDAGIAKKLVDSGIGNICISLDSLNEEHHDFLRGQKGSYKMVMQAVGHFKKYPGNYNLAIATIIVEKNLDDIKDLVDWVMKDNRISAIIFQAVVQPFGAPQDNKWYQDCIYNTLWPQDIKKVVATIDNLIHLKTECLDAGGQKISNSTLQLKAFKEYFRNPQIFIKRLTCNIANSGSFALNPDGNIFLCTYMEPIGNAINTDIDKIFNSDKAYEIQDRIKKCRRNCHMLVNCWYEDEKVGGI